MIRIPDIAKYVERDLSCIDGVQGLLIYSGLDYKIGLVNFSSWHRRNSNIVLTATVIGRIGQSSDLKTSDAEIRSNRRLFPTVFNINEYPKRFVGLKKCVLQFDVRNKYERPFTDDEFSELAKSSDNNQTSEYGDPARKSSNRVMLTKHPPWTALGFRLIVGIASLVLTVARFGHAKVLGTFQHL